MTCKLNTCHCFCAQTFLSSNVFVHRRLIKRLRPKSSELKLNDGIGAAKVPPFIVNNLHIFTEKAALMCTEGSDKLGCSNANHADVFHELEITEELWFVALGWRGKCLNVCLRVAQGEMPMKYYRRHAFDVTFTCFLFLFMHRLCSPGGCYVLRWPKPDFLPILQKPPYQSTAILKYKILPINHYNSHLDSVLD